MTRMPESSTPFWAEYLDDYGRARRLRWAAGSGILGLFASFALLKGNILGEGTRQKTSTEIVVEAFSEYQEVAEGMDAKERYEAGYLGGVIIRVDSHTSGSGLRGWLDRQIGFVTHGNPTDRLQFGSNCLNGSPYDTMAGSAGIKT